MSSVTFFLGAAFFGELFVKVNCFCDQLRFIQSTSLCPSDEEVEALPSWFLLLGAKPKGTATGNYNEDRYFISSDSFFQCRDFVTEVSLPRSSLKRSGT